MTKKLILATHNPGKIREFERLFRDLPYQLISQQDFAVPECEEPASTFIENALIKARHASAHTGLPALADDSGLVVPALQGEPGIYSARYASSDDQQANWKKLLDKLQLLPADDRSAYFYCCLVFIRHPLDPTPLVTEGIWHGQIALEATGDKGFGYDPVFYLPQLQCTAAQLSPEEKNSISHRAQALAKMKDRLPLEK
ncbi:MAG: RdgB/HAM1 family non-canonical purine NTP pyrophosphatase [Gammaproteobacteria bacterium]|nr:RdgB/HAM1 family non-canonical purine NTP pyrophosphatase [Gammaproteobacteria bacterium]